MSTSAETTPSRRLLACAAQIAQHYDLPQKDRIQSLAEEPDVEPYLVSKMADELLAEARRSLVSIRRASRFDLASSLARNCGWAATMAYTLRSAATAGSSAPPTDESWDLLMMLTTLLYIRARQTHNMFGLTTLYNDLAVALHDVDPEL